MLCNVLNSSFFIFFAIFLTIVFFNIFLNVNSVSFNIKLNMIMCLLLLIYVFIFILYNFYTIYNFILFRPHVLLYNINYFYYFPFLFIFIIITIISVLFCLNYNLSELGLFLIYVSFIIFSGFNLLITNSMVIFFLFYEFLLIPSFFILYIFSKTRRSVEASYLMFFWTQFGALWLLLGLIYIYKITNSLQFSIITLVNFSTTDSYVIFFCLLFVFGVKLPIWPFYEWLPKAHVEASTNFSIFLSGVLVKFAFFGFFKFLCLLNLDINFFIIFPYLFFGLIESVFKMFYQVDIKKLIAYSTVVEMHWLLVCLLSGNNVLLLSAFGMYISHAILSTNSFLLVDSITRRFKTRLIFELSGLNYLCPKLFLFALINLIVFLGFPGSLFFISEFLFFFFFFDLFPFFCFLLFIFIYFILANIFIKIWLNVLFSSIPAGLVQICVDLDKIELLVFSFLIGLIFWLGSSWLTLII